MTPWTVAGQAPLSMEFSRQEYWSGLPFPSAGDRPTQGLKLGLLNCRQILYLLGHLSLQGSPVKQLYSSNLKKKTERSLSVDNLSKKNTVVQGSADARRKLAQNWQEENSNRWVSGLQSGRKLTDNQDLWRVWALLRCCWGKEI